MVRAQGDRVRAGLAITLLVALGACGQRPLSEHMAAHDGAATAGGGTGATAPGETAGSATGDAAASAAGGVGGLGAGDADGTVTGGNGQSFATPACAPDASMELVTGAIGDRSFTLEPRGSFEGWPLLRQTWSIVRVASADQALLVWGNGGPGGGIQRNAGGVLVMPDVSPPGATYYCAAQVDADPTFNASGPKAAIALSQLSVLGQCPGAPVAGNVQVCTDGGPAADGGGGCAQGMGVSGWIDGAAVDLWNLGGQVSRLADAPSSSFEVFVLGDDNGLIVVDSGADSVAGWLRIPDGPAPNAGTIYCLGGGHLTALAMKGAYAVTFQSYGRLGRCPGAAPIDGRIDLCR
jgi:hypothetical protein